MNVTQSKQIQLDFQPSNVQYLFFNIKKLQSLKIEAYLRYLQ